MMTSHVEQVCSLGNSRYLISPKPVGSISIPKDWSIENPYLPFPATILRIDGLQTITSSWIQNTLDDMLTSDDVLCKEFLSCILFQSATQGPWPMITDDHGALQNSWRNSAFCTSDLLPGPYFVMNSTIRKVFKLCADPCGAFMYGVVQSEEGPERYTKFRFLELSRANTSDSATDEF